MKILHTADWHIGQFKGPVVDGVNLRLQDTVKCLEYMVEVAQKEKPDIVCISGDIFHQEQIGPVRYSDEMIIATDTITKLADIAKGVIVMRGTPNHDGSGQFRVLDRMFAKTSHVHIITAPTVLHTPYTDIACIPGFGKQEFRAKFPGLSADEENLAWSKYISDMVFGIYGAMELDARKKLADARKELASKKEAVRIKTDFIKAQGNPEEELETVEKDIHKKQEELENLDESRRKLLERQEKISEAEKESEKARSELKECSEECGAMEHDLEYSKQTLTACNNLLEMADVIREKAKQHSELSLQLSDVEKAVIKYKNAKETLNGYTEDADRYQRLIDKSKFRNDQIRNRISQLAFNVPDDLEERLDALANQREEIEYQQEKRYLYSTAQNELHEIYSSYLQKISGAENRRDYRQKRIAEIRQQEEFMKNSGCPDIESASCRFLSKAVEDVKSLPIELDNLKKCEEEIEILASERDKKIADTQEEIERIGYDPKRLAILTASVSGECIS